MTDAAAPHHVDSAHLFPNPILQPSSVLPVETVEATLPCLWGRPAAPRYYLAVLLATVTIGLLTLHPLGVLQAQQQRLVDPPVLSLLNPTRTLSVNQAEVDTLTLTDFLLPIGHRVTAWRIALPSAGTYQLDLRSTDFDPYLYVFGGTRSPLLEPDPHPYALADDDGGEGLDARLCVSFRDDEASVVVAARNEGLGRYSLSLTRRDCTMSTGSELDTFFQSSTADLAAIPISGDRYLQVGREISTTLGQNDTMLNQRRVQSWLLHKVDGQRLSIMVDSDDFDAYLAVLSPARQLVFDDDGGVGTNARLDLAAHTNGEYRIFVTSWSPDAIGSFQLRALSRLPSGG